LILRRRLLVAASITGNQNYAAQLVLLVDATFAQPAQPRLQGEVSFRANVTSLPIAASERLFWRALLRKYYSLSSCEHRNTEQPGKKNWAGAVSSGPS
jgi:hypothetical protein